MAVIDEQIVIRRKPQEVYDYLIDLTNQPKWETTVLSVTPRDGNYTVHDGSEIDYVFKLGAFKMKGVSVISGLEPGHTGHYSVTSRLGNSEGSYTVEDHADGALFVHHVEISDVAQLRAIRLKFLREDLLRMKTVVGGGEKQRDIDDRFFLIHEEADFCLRAREAGFRCGVLAEALVWHKGSSAFKRSGKRWQRYYDTRNLGLLLSKHAARSSAGRGALASYAVYLRYAYHRYCHEREDGQPDAADAVLEGLIDAATRRFGPHVGRKRWAVPVLRGVFEVARRLRPARNGAPADARRDLWAGRGTT